MSQIKPLDIKGVDGFNERNTRAYRMFSNPFSNNLVLAGKNSGKTTLLYRMIEKSLAPKMTLHVFSSTYNIDPIMMAIIDMCETNGNKVIAKDHWIDEDFGINYIEEFLNTQQEEADARSNPESIAPSSSKYDDLFNPEPEPVTAKPKKWKQHLSKNSPKHIMIIDDLSHATRDPSIFKLMSKNRHYSVRLIMLSHFITSLAPNAINQLDNIFIFPGQPPHRIQEINDKLGLVHPKDTKKEPYMQKLYDEATKKKYNFLKIDKDQMKFFHNFDKELF